MAKNVKINQTRFRSFLKSKMGGKRVTFEKNVHLLIYLDYLLFLKRLLEESETFTKNMELEEMKPGVIKSVGELLLKHDAEKIF